MMAQKKKTSFYTSSLEENGLADGYFLEGGEEGIYASHREKIIC